jgi:hypothetical protein
MMKLVAYTAIGLAVAFVSIDPASGTERDDVICPAGTTANLANGVLKCSVILTYTRGSICPPLKFPNYTQIDVAGADQCKPQVTTIDNKAAVASAMTPPPARVTMPQGTAPGLETFVNGVVQPPDSAYTRQVNATGPDAFVARKTVFVWPDGLPLPNTVGHSPDSGVSCPSGFDTDPIQNGRGLRCSDTVVKKAVCDAGWTIERKSGRDLCTNRDLLGNRVIGQFTIPENAGYVGLMGNPAQHGWTLDTDRSGNVDYWVKNGTVYRYPVAR